MKRASSDPPQIQTNRTMISVLLWLGLITASIAGGVVLPKGLDLLNSEFLLNYLGVCLGLMIAIITFLHGVADRLMEKLVQDYDIIQDNDPAKAARVRQTVDQIQELFTGLKQSTLGMFVVLVMNITVVVLGAFQLPSYLLYLPVTWSFSLDQLYVSVKAGSILYSLIAIYLLIANLFQIIDAAAEARPKLAR